MTLRWFVWLSAALWPTVVVLVAPEGSLTGEAFGLLAIAAVGGMVGLAPPSSPVGPVDYPAAD